MITKQEGGMDQGRLALPGEKGDWVARNLIPSLPVSLCLLCPSGAHLLPGSEAHVLSGGESVDLKRAEISPKKAKSFKCQFPSRVSIGCGHPLRHFQNSPQKILPMWCCTAETTALVNAWTRAEIASIFNYQKLYVVLEDIFWKLY